MSLISVARLTTLTARQTDGQPGEHTRTDGQTDTVTSDVRAWPHNARLYFATDASRWNRFPGSHAAYTRRGTVRRVYTRPVCVHTHLASSAFVNSTVLERRRASYVSVATLWPAKANDVKRKRREAVMILWQAKCQDLCGRCCVRALGVKWRGFEPWAFGKSRMSISY